MDIEKLRKFTEEVIDLCYSSYDEVKVDDERLETLLASQASPKGDSDLTLLKYSTATEAHIMKARDDVYKKVTDKVRIDTIDECIEIAMKGRGQLDIVERLEQLKTKE